MLYSLHDEMCEKATTSPDPYRITEKEAYDKSYRMHKYEILVTNNPDVVPLSTILKVFMLSGIKD
jgi:hypothetical protein